MENLTGKISLIDILGMMLPGGLTLMLFENDIGFLSFMSESMGEQHNVILWGISFLLGSYFVGMMLHELSSMLEKLLWLNPITDPRVYAVVKTGFFVNELPQKSENWRVEAGTVFLLAQTALLGFLYLASGCGNIAEFFVSANVLAGTILIVHRTYYEQLFSIMKEDILLEGREAVFQLEVRSYRMLNKTGERTRKMEVFNGFRILARSILAMFAVAQTYVVLSQGNEASYLVQLEDQIRSTPALAFLRQLMVVVLIARYWHYSCLQYLYRYNAFFQSSENTTKDTGVTA